MLNFYVSGRRRDAFSIEVKQTHSKIIHYFFIVIVILVNWFAVSTYHQFGLIVHNPVRLFPGDQLRVNSVFIGPDQTTTWQNQALEGPVLKRARGVNPSGAPPPSSFGSSRLESKSRTA